MSTMDLGLAALVADSDGSVVSALVGLVVAGVGLGVVMNMRGEEIDLADVPKIKDAAWNWANYVHPDYSGETEPGGTYGNPVRLISPEEQAVYRDWLLEHRDPEAHEAGKLLALREQMGRPPDPGPFEQGWDAPIEQGWDAPFIWTPRPEQIVCENMLVRRGPAEPHARARARARDRACLEFARQVLGMMGHDANALVPPDARIVADREDFDADATLRRQIRQMREMREDDEAYEWEEAEEDRTLAGRARRLHSGHHGHPAEGRRAAPVAEGPPAVVVSLHWPWHSDLVEWWSRPWHSDLVEWWSRIIVEPRPEGKPGTVAINDLADIMSCRAAYPAP